METQTLGIFSEHVQQLIAESVINIVNSTAIEAKTIEKKRYYKKKAFCEEMSISNNTLSLWISKGLKCIQVEGITMIDMEDAVTFLEEHKI